MITRDGGSTEHDTVVQIIDPLRRYVRAHTISPAETDDVVQESLTRVLERRSSLTAESLLAYAIVVARNVMTDRYRDAVAAQRRGHRLVDLTAPAGPEDVAVLAERDEALLAALSGVPEGQRDALLAHVLDERPLTAIAAEEGSTSGSMAAQMSRTRARLRLDYVLALRRVDLPSGRCRPVLLALSAGDQRRQAALRAGQHLVTCTTCAGVSRPLLERRHGLASVVPWFGLGAAGDVIRRVLHPSPGPAIAATAVVAGAAVVTAVVVTGADTTTVSTTPSTSTTSTQRPAVAPPDPSRLEPLALGEAALPDATRLATLVGAAVTATGVTVSSVPADEGFWIGDAGHRLWVQIVTAGAESPVTVAPGDALSFTGTVSAHDARFAADVGVSDAEGAAELSADGVHLAVPSRSLRVAGTR